MGRVGRSIELRSKHLATRTGLHHRRAITFSIGQADPPVVPVAGALHQQRVNSVDSQRAHSLQNVGDGWRAGTGITAVIRHVRIEATDARALLFLYEHIAAIAIPAHPSENHGSALGAEIPAGSNPRGVVVHPANYRVATQVDLAGDGF